MKYINANVILPEKVIEEIQKYIQGKYIYIPIKKEKTDATIPVFNVIQSGVKSIVPIIHLPKNDISQILTLPHLSEGMR